jgi:hypothetical protein
MAVALALVGLVVGAEDLEKPPEEPNAQALRHLLSLRKPSATYHCRCPSGGLTGPSKLMKHTMLTHGRSFKAM